MHRHPRSIGKGKGTPIVLRTTGASTDHRYPMQTARRWRSLKPRSITFCQAHSYLPSFTASQSLAATYLYCLL